jgi:hypothetical protein
MVVALLPDGLRGTGRPRFARGGDAGFGAGRRRTVGRLCGVTAGSLAGCRQPESLQEQGVDGDQEAVAGHR